MEINNHSTMQYRPGAGGDMLSVLGFGCMLFTKKGGGRASGRGSCILRTRAAQSP